MPLNPGKPVLYPLETISYSGKIVNVPIIITNAEGIKSFCFQVNYSSDLLEFIGLKESPLTHGFDFVRGIKDFDGIINHRRKSQHSY